MQKIGFAEALDSIVASDPRYQRDAYVFLRDALDFTTKQQKKIKGVSVRHVTGPELLDGVRRYALKEFGPMVITVFDNWGIHSCEDVGNIVFNLIGAGVFGKTVDCESAIAFAGAKARHLAQLNLDRRSPITAIDAPR